MKMENSFLPRKKMKRSQAFTLVELLVVIAVVGILAGLLLGALSVAKKDSLRVACLDRLKQINLGVRMYADDSGGKLPDVPAGLYPNGTRFFYKELVKSYLGMRGTSCPCDTTFACPADRACGWVQPLSLLAESDYNSYLFNAGGNFIRRGKSGLKSGNLDWVGLPASTILVAEQPAFLGYSWHNPQRGGVPIPPVTMGPATHGAGQLFSYNNAQAMASFVDGHVKYIKIYYDGRNLPLYYNPAPGYEYQWTGDRPAN
jgi:prepilin-type N-terminal cleavage/methylation domain-containing protein/prepilin-type processing-associated H-X9-DG protein